MIKPLVISRQYLLEKNPVGQIERVFWEYVYNQGLKPSILCSKSNRNDVPITKSQCEIIQTNDNKFIEYLILSISKLTTEDISHLPDSSYFSWAKVSAIRQIKKIIANGKFDYIHSVCRSYSNHMIALAAKRESGLPWVASFYDPWYENPYRNFKFDYFNKKDRKFESEVAENADVIIHTNQAIYDEWLERYGNSIGDKMYVMPLVFNPNYNYKENGAEKIIKRDDTKFVISHIGTLFKGRDSVDFLKALNLLIQEKPDLKDRIILNYVGTVTEDDRQYIAEHNLSGIANFVGYLSEKECECYFENSDLFLVIDGKGSRNIFFPSKVMKYFYYGKPILGLTPSHSALQYELEESNNFCFTNEDYQGVANFLLQALTKAGYLSRNSKDYWRKFTMETQFPEYMKIVNTILKRG